MDYQPAALPPTLTFTMAWACKYDSLGGCTPPPSPPSVPPSPGGAAPGADTAPAPGGFYQPTSAAQARELHAAIAAAHAAHHGPSRGGTPLTPPDHASPLALTSRLALELPLETLYALTTPSGYARLHPSGRRTAPGTGAGDFGGTLPLATPAFLDSRNLLAVVDYPTDGSDSSLLVVYASYGTLINTTDPTTGATKPFRVSSLTLGGITYPLGRTRSSPAWDRTSHLYVASDLDVGLGAAFLPAVLSVDAAAVVRWGAALDGASADATVGCASVVVTLGPRKDARLYIAAEDGVHAVQEPAASAGGAVCPSEGLVDCNDHGDCDCASGTCRCWGCWSGADCGSRSEGACTGSGGTCTQDGHCTCGDACHSGPDCSTLKQCGAGGVCNPLDGSCTCPGVCLTLNYFGRCGVANSSLCANGGVCDGTAGPGLCACVGPAACFTGPDSSQPIVCGAHSVCVPGVGGGPGGCTCTGGWSGPSCTTPPPPPPGPPGGGGSGASSGSKASPGAVAAGVLVPLLLLLGAGAAGLVVAVRQGYHLPWPALDSLVQQWVGGGGAGSAYTQLKTPMGGVAAAAGGAGGAGAEAAAGRLAASRGTTPRAVAGGAGSEKMSLLQASRSAAPKGKGSPTSAPVYSSL